MEEDCLPVCQSILGFDNEELETIISLSCGAVNCDNRSPPHRVLRFTPSGSLTRSQWLERGREKEWIDKNSTNCEGGGSLSLEFTFGHDEQKVELYISLIREWDLSHLVQDSGVINPSSSL